MEGWSGSHSTCSFISTKNLRCARPLERNMTSSAARSRAGYPVQGERLLRSPRGKAEVHQRESEPQKFHRLSSLRPCAPVVNQVFISSTTFPKFLPSAKSL